MKQLLSILLLFITTQGFSQANEDTTDRYQLMHDIIITKANEVMHVVKEGSYVTAKIDGKNVDGRWMFKALPDEVYIVDKKGNIIGQFKLNDQKTLKIVTPEPKAGVGVGIGIGPVSVSSMGPGYQSFNMEKYKAYINERMETREEKLRREYEEKEQAEKERKALEKQAKKDAKKNR